MCKTNLQTSKYNKLFNSSNNIQNNVNLSKNKETNNNSLKINELVVIDVNNLKISTKLLNEIRLNIENEFNNFYSKQIELIEKLNDFS